MAADPSKLSKRGRRSTIADHPHLGAIEAAVAAGTSFRLVAERHSLSKSALYRHWVGLPEPYRSALRREAGRVEGRKLREVAADLRGLARRHPSVGPDVRTLIAKLQASPIAAPAATGQHGASA